MFHFQVKILINISAYTGRGIEGLGAIQIMFCVKCFCHITSVYIARLRLMFCTFPSRVFSNACCVLSQCNTQLKFLYLINKKKQRSTLSGNANVLFAGSVRNVNQILCCVKLIIQQNGLVVMRSSLGVIANCRKFSLM